MVPKETPSSSSLMDDVPSAVAFKTLFRFYLLETLRASIDRGFLPLLLIDAGAASEQRIDRPKWKFNS